jgi:hypothetical protein
MSRTDAPSRTTTRRLRNRVPAGFLRNQHHRQSSAVWVNDVHSQLNRTRVKTLLTPRAEIEVAAAIEGSARAHIPICVSGCRHATGGQQFASAGVLLDMRQMSRVLSFDEELGLIEVEAGIQWPELIQTCLDVQPGTPAPWTIAQKQTGADTFTLGGSLSANVHGRGLTMKPLVGDIESFTLMDAKGESVTCSRLSNSELFQLAIGGYGLFGIITRVTLRLARRRKLQRVVEMVRADELISKFDERIRDGCIYGDFQFSIDEESDNFLQLGVLSCYRTPADRTRVSAGRHISGDDWLKLLHLAYTDRAEGFRRYTDYYLTTNGQTYWSDTHQLSPYLRANTNAGKKDSKDQSDDFRALRATGQPCRFPPSGRTAPTCGPRSASLWDRSVDRAGRRDVPSVGSSGVRMYHFQSSNRA